MKKDFIVRWNGRVGSPRLHPETIHLYLYSGLDICQERELVWSIE